jgi:hypothetical protein
MISGKPVCPVHRLDTRLLHGGTCRLIVGDVRDPFEFPCGRGRRAPRLPCIYDSTQASVVSYNHMRTYNIYAPA